MSKIKVEDGWVALAVSYMSDKGAPTFRSRALKDSAGRLISNRVSFISEYSHKISKPLYN